MVLNFSIERVFTEREHFSSKMSTQTRVYELLNKLQEVTNVDGRERPPQIPNSLEHSKTVYIQRLTDDNTNIEILHQLADFLNIEHYRGAYIGHVTLNDYEDEIPSKIEECLQLILNGFIRNNAVY
jgi:hypothetical protein